MIDNMRLIYTLYRKR